MIGTAAGGGQSVTRRVLVGTGKPRVGQATRQHYYYYYEVTR
jgi:hypothetical protein